MIKLNKIPLSPRQEEVLKWASFGLNLDRIGEKLGISPATVNTHLMDARSKLGMPTIKEGYSIRALLTRYYIEHFERTD